MKKHIATLWVFALTVGFVSTVMVSDARAQFFSRAPLTLQNITLNLTTPEDIAHYMWRNFSFVNDQTQFGEAEYWQTPEEFLQNRQGDCEDFALLAKELLGRIGKKAFLLNVYGHKYAHTICVFMEDGKYQVMDGTDVKRYNAETLQEVMTRLYPHWKTGAIVDMSPKSKKGRILKKFQKDAKIKKAFLSSL